MSEENLGRASAGLNLLVTGKRFLHALSGDHASLPLWDLAPRTSCERAAPDPRYG